MGDMLVFILTANEKVGGLVFFTRWKAIAAILHVFITFSLAPVQNSQNVLDLGRTRRQAVGVEDTDHRLGCILLNNIGLVQHIELFRGVATSKDQNGLLSAGMVRQERGDIQNLTVDNDPAVLRSVVLGNLCGGDQGQLCWLGSNRCCGCRGGVHNGGSTGSSTPANLQVDLLFAWVNSNRGSESTGEGDRLSLSSLGARSDDGVALGIVTDGVTSGTTKDDTSEQ